MVLIRGQYLSVDIAPYAVILYKEPVYPIYYHRVRDEKNHNMYL